MIFFQLIESISINQHCHLVGCIAEPAKSCNEVSWWNRWLHENIFTHSLKYGHLTILDSPVPPGCQWKADVWILYPSDLFILHLAHCITFNKKHTGELYNKFINGRQLSREPQNTQQSVLVEPQSHYKLKLKLDTVNTSWTAHSTLLCGDVSKTTSSLETTVKSHVAQTELLHIRNRQGFIFSEGSGNDKGYHEANFLDDFLVLFFLIGQQPLKREETVRKLHFSWHLVRIRLTYFLNPLSHPWVTP